MEMNTEFKQYTNEFLKEFKLSKEKWGELKKLWDRKCSQEFVKWFNQIIAVALRNLSVDNKNITEREEELPNVSYRQQSWGRSKLLVATKNGIREKYHYRTKTDELSFEGMCYMVERKADIKKWFQLNKPDREVVFDELITALEFTLPNFSLKTMANPSSSYYGYQPQHSIQEFNVSNLSVNTFSAKRDKVEEATLISFEFSRHSDYFEVYAIIIFKDGDIERVSFSGSVDNWIWLFMKDCFPELNKFLDVSLSKVKNVQADFDNWVANIKQKLLSYATLVEL